jgi:hypothetical protein
MFAMILSVFRCFSSVSKVCFKCFICLLLYVTSVVSECFESRSGCCTWDAHGKRKGARAVPHV